MAAVLAQDQADSLFERLTNVTRSVISPIVRRKLHASLEPHDTTPRNLDALELVGDIRVTLLTELSREPANGNIHIRDLNSFASAVAANACYQYLRSKFPVRTQQRNRLRYVLTHKKGYTLWKDGSGQTLCGLERWQLSGERPVAIEKERTAAICRDSSFDNARAYLSVIESLLDDMGGPVRFDELVQFLMEHFGIADRVEVQQSVDPERLSPSEGMIDHANRPDLKLETTVALERLWKKIKDLKVNQRRALLLNLRDGGSEGIISVLPLSGVASIREIAGVLEFDVREFTSIWNSLPWDDLKIAEYFGTTRQQVINYRHDARVRLARLLR